MSILNSSDKTCRQGGAIRLYAFDKSKEGLSTTSVKLNTKSFSSFSPSAGKGFSACLGRHLGQEALAAFPDDIRPSLNVFFHFRFPFF